MDDGEDYKAGSSNPAIRIGALIEAGNTVTFKEIQ